MCGRGSAAYERRAMHGRISKSGHPSPELPASQTQSPPGTHTVITVALRETPLAQLQLDMYPGLWVLLAQCSMLTDATLLLHSQRTPRFSHQVCQWVPQITTFRGGSTAVSECMGFELLDSNPTHNLLQPRHLIPLFVKAAGVKAGGTRGPGWLLGMLGAKQKETDPTERRPQC